MSLSTAYAKYKEQQINAELARLKTELEIEKQNATNKSKSVGSVSTDGKKDKRSMYDDLWGD